MSQTLGNLYGDFLAGFFIGFIVYATGYIFRIVLTTVVEALGKGPG